MHSNGLGSRISSSKTKSKTEQTFYTINSIVLNMFASYWYFNIRK